MATKKLMQNSIRLEQMDSRDLHRAADWLPIIPDRDRLPLLELLKGAQLTNGFVRQLNAVCFSRDELRRAAEIKAQREATALELTIPAWWHYYPVRSHRCGNDPRGWCYGDGV